MTTPSAPSATTDPAKSSSPRRTVRSVPSGPTISSAATADARFLLASPEPCVAVATAPATEMCGRDARLCDRPAGGVQVLRERPVAGAARDGDGPRLLVDLRDRLQGVQRDQRRGIVGKVVEAVPGAQRADPRGARDELLQLLDGAPGGARPPRGRRSCRPSWSESPVQPTAAGAVRKMSNMLGSCACTSTMNTNRSNSRCTATTYVSDVVRRKIQPWISANGMVSSGPHSR